MWHKWESAGDRRPLRWFEALGQSGWKTKILRRTGQTTGWGYSLRRSSHSDGKLILAYSYLEASVWPVSRWKEIASMEREAATFRNDGKVLAIVSPDEITVWDLGASKKKYALGVPNRIHRIAINPDGTLFAFGCFDKRIRLWNMVKKNRRQTLKGASMLF